MIQFNKYYKCSCKKYRNTIIKKEREFNRNKIDIKNCM